MKAKWDIMTQSDGQIEVIYRNLVADWVFRCGACKPGTPIELILEFIHSEGDPGDYVFENGTPIGSLYPTVLS